MGWIEQIANHTNTGDQFLSQFDALRPERRSKNCHSRDVAARLVEAWNEAEFHRIADCGKDNWNRRGRSLGSESSRRTAGREKERHGQADEFCRQRWQTVVMPFRPAESDCEIASLDKTHFTQTLPKGSDHTCGLAGGSAAEEANHRHRCLLRARRERPRHSAAEQRDELAADHLRAHSITSSARPSRGSGMLRPNVFAVCRLMTSSTLTACWTGISAGFSPLRIRPA